MRKHWSIDFSFIFNHFGPQVASQNRPQTQKKRFKIASKIEHVFECVFESLPDAKWWGEAKARRSQGFPFGLAKSLSFQDRI